MLRFLLVIPFIFLVSFCVQQGVRPVGFESYNVAVIQVASSVSGAEEEVITLASLVVDDLQKENVFQYVFLDDTELSVDKTLLVKLNIDYLSRTTDAERIAMGKFARSNEVRVEVLLTDYTSGKELSSFRLRGLSPRREGISIEWPWGTIDKALQQISEQLIKRLAGWSGQS